MDVVMRGGDVVNGLKEGEFPTFRNGRCIVRFPKDGNWATQNGFNVGGFDANSNSICPGLTLPGPKDMEYRLQKDGNFVARCGYYVDYRTHTGQGVEGDYFMAIDDQCVLHIYKGTFDCDSVNIEAEIWTNVRYEPLKKGDHLGQGEFVRNESEGTSLLMQSQDGNLVLYKSGPSGPEGEVLWAANMEWDAPPGPNVNHYYARVTSNGHITLVGIDYFSGPGFIETVYFDKDLHTNADCFTVEYDADADDLVAVSCD